MFLYTSCTCTHADCVCNEHASDCEFIPTQSTSVCIDCSDNTAGDQCNECLPSFFQDMTLLLNDANICQGEDLFVVINSSKFAQYSSVLEIYRQILKVK